MSKKSKSKASDGPRPLISKKLKKRFIRFIFLGLLISSALAFYDPNLIPNPDLRQQVEGIKSEILTYTNESLHLPSKLPESLALDQILDNLPQGSVLGEEEIEVENVFGIITQQLKTLPQKEAKKIKYDFCADLIFEATASATP